MKTFKNINFTKRYAFGTTIAFCQSETNPNPKMWMEVTEDALQASGATQLHKQGDVRYFGWI